MKKFIITALCAVVTFCSVGFAACSEESSESGGLIDAGTSGSTETESTSEIESSNDSQDVTIDFQSETESSSGIINLENYEVGDELPVYPDCEFGYKLSDDCTVYISEIKAILTAKNEINEGDVLEDRFIPYEITAYASGYTSVDFCGKKFALHISVKPGSTSYYGIAEITADGTFECEFPCNFGTSFTTISFSYLSLYSA